MDNWLRKNPGKTAIIYDIPEIANEAHSQAFTPRTISAGFMSTGIYPYNSELFTEVDFAPSEVTNRSNPDFQEDQNAQESEVTPFLDVVQGETSSKTQRASANETNEVDNAQISLQDPTTAVTESANDKTTDVSHQRHAGFNRPVSPIAGPSGVFTPDEPHTPKKNKENNNSYVSPIEIAPFPKAGPRKNVTNKRRKKTTILTESPHRNALAAMRLFKEKKVQKSKPKGKRCIFQLTQDSDFDDVDIEEVCRQSPSEMDPYEDEEPEQNEDSAIELTVTAILAGIFSYRGIREFRGSAENCDVVGQHQTEARDSESTKSLNNPRRSLRTAWTLCRISIQHHRLQQIHQIQIQIHSLIQRLPPC
ncbi:transposase [Elysia marginata]|uniref:Transposase n=1 Tax=Elysia marginata TaxID=1093978 RepID=A0AAV4G2Q6_9GAST|nr:transposase [Elysia marginata]